MTALFKVPVSNYFSSISSCLKLSSILLLLFGFLQSSTALEGILKDNIKVTSHIADGYITVEIPFYENSGDDEGLMSGSYLSVNGQKCLEFYSLKDGKEDGFFGTADSYSIWIKRGPGAIRAVKENKDGATVLTSYVTHSFKIAEGDAADLATATYLVYLDESLLGTSLDWKVYLKPDENNTTSISAFEKTGSISKVDYSIPNLTYGFSNTAGKYDLSIAVPGARTGSRYWYTSWQTLVGTSTSLQINVMETSRPVTIYFDHKVSDYQWKRTQSIITLPAYQQATQFIATGLANGDTRITWNAGAAQNPQIENDNFEVSRADNPEFNNAITVVNKVFVSDKRNYEIIDQTSLENINGTLHYRIRRTKTANQWQWGFGETTDIVKSMAHRYIANANATLSRANIANVTWVYDDGNVWIPGSKVIIERYNLSSGGAKETIVVPEDSMVNQSYSEELFQACNKFTYKVLVEPGNNNYDVQEAVNANGDDIIPIETGNVLTLNASKGYYADRTELTWSTDGLPITIFAIKSRIYQSGDEFKQIDQVDGSNATKLYQYNDEKCNPGEIYEYQLIGLVSCAEKTVSTDTLYAFGFRTPTGDIYGRVTFESGQAVNAVEVRLESSDGVVGQSMLNTGGEAATIADTTFLTSNTDSLTLQAWVAPNSGNGTQIMFSKLGMYELAIVNNAFNFLVGTDTLSSTKSVSDYLAASAYMHLSAVYTGDSLFLYVDGKLSNKRKSTLQLYNDSTQIQLGSAYSGAIDEIRVWNRVLDSLEIKSDYNKYITGGEKGLIAYWNFNYATTNEFYDLSYKGSKYNEHHGQLNGAVLSSTKIPSNEQLGYKGVTGDDGSYAIRAIPYIGNGTVYTLIPRKGIHSFEAQKEVRFIGVGSQSHTVNFVDKSSFKVAGTISYAGGTIPVEGVSLSIDGIIAVAKNGSIIRSKLDGTFEIQVPVGIHEVKLSKQGHVFENDGRITTSTGLDRNYQDQITGLTLSDITKVKYIGRVAGGAIQDAYPVGHSLSTNNLADGVKIILRTVNPAYEISSSQKTLRFKHFKPSNKSNDWSKNNDVLYDKETVIIYPNPETGEFVAELIPESFTITVMVPGHDDIPGSGEPLNLTQYLFQDKEIYSYMDSTKVDENWIKTYYSDTVLFNYSQKFIKRYKPTVSIVQLDETQRPLSFYGSSDLMVKSLDNTETNLKFWSDGSYLIGKPVFEQKKFYTFQAKVFEAYIYKDNAGAPKAGIHADEVPTKDAKIEFNNNISTITIASVDADSMGVALYTFQANEPELTSALRAISAKVYYGDGGTSIPWDDSFEEAIILGGIQTGKDFVTGGPDKVLTVLRDPPGSNSYAYLEKGISITSSSSYSGSGAYQESILSTNSLGKEVITWTGVGGGLIVTNELINDKVLGVTHRETVGGSDSEESTTTFTTRFQTSDDPDFVGADADVFIGYSTNISYGSTENVNIISKEQFQSDPLKYQIYEAITPKSGDWYLVKQTGLGMAQTFSTLFAYPQVHIVNRLLPEMNKLRNNFLMQETPELTIDALQNIANTNDTVFYVSHLLPEDPNYGKSNNDNAFKDMTDPDPEDIFNGVSYQIIYPEREDFTRSDTILYLNQSINNWYKHLAANEKAKLNATLMQNYSLQAGSPIGYNESYSKTTSSTLNYSFMIGGNYQQIGGGKVARSGAILTFDENIETEHGWESTDATERSNSKGFELSENGNDYLSVDVMRESTQDIFDSEAEEESNTEFYSSFIFRTKGGATSCPYEGANVTKYYEPGKHVIDEATKRIEVPEIAVARPDFVENIPSGASANFKLYLRNNSEIQQDNWFTLKVVEESNPDGAKLFIDGAAISNGKDFLVPAGGTLVKTLEVQKGSVLNYDNLQLVLQSRCQDDIGDTATFTVHYTPSCSEVNIAKPSDKWTYNTKMPMVSVDGVNKHYMDVILDGFDVYYDSFNHIKLQYKIAAQSDDDWITLMKFYSDTLLLREAKQNGNAEYINPEDAGKIKYVFMMDNLPDQRYDLRAVSVCLINNQEVENLSETKSGIKDMLRPRLFGAAQPASGILSIENEVRLNFNEMIAEGYLTQNNFQVTGIRNGATSDHSVSIRLDGENDFLATEFDKNMSGKDIVVEMWIKSNLAQDATLFSHGNINNSIELALTADNHIKVTVGDEVLTSESVVPFEAGSWAHISFVYEKTGVTTAYYNFAEVIRKANVGAYTGIGNVVLGKSIRNVDMNFEGYIHNTRIWNKVLSSGQLQVNSLAVLSGNEAGLLGYYPMNRAKGDFAEDKARGANLLMNGCEWALPDGRSVDFNGLDSYLTLNTGSSAVIDETMDFTLEFWFKGEAGQSNRTLLSNGRGDGKDYGGSHNMFSVGFDANGHMTFSNNAFTSTSDSTYLDNNWHHFAVSVNRTIGRGQIYIDGVLKDYFDSDNLGGIASNTITVGARSWVAQDASNQKIIDNFFKGKIDEVRIWNLYKNETLVDDNSNVKLDGGEMGLLAYYPFEHYIIFQGTPELNYTLKDVKQQVYIENAVPDALATAAIESPDNAPVRDKGPVSNLQYDFVVNNDALIINLREDLDRIEKTIITFTADGIRDMNGNENISPIIWSAYIDRNQLKWSERELNLSKDVNTPLEFVVKVVNKGGSIQKFKIENMPSWMEINPEKGTIGPDDSENVLFVIDEGLNVGSYNESIYLINENNVLEVLDINITVMGPKPNWKVDPSDYAYSMSIFGKMRFNNIFSSDKGDLLAAFKDDVCIGVTNSIYKKDQDFWYALLPVYSNEKQFDMIEFRMWDASTGVSYVADAGEPINFVNNSVVGTLLDLTIFDAENLVYQNINLDEGWNWISFNVNADELSSLDATLANLDWNSSNFFKSEAENVSANYSQIQLEWVAEKPLVLNQSSMYKLSSSVAQTISLSGAIVKPGTQTIDIKGQQWNYIGYLPTAQLPLDEALAGYDAKNQDVIKSQHGFAMYAERIGWLGSLTFMQPGKGYMLYRTDAANVSFNYPSSRGSLSTKSARIMDTNSDYVNPSFSGNMNLIAQSNIKTQVNDRILAYVGDELSAITTIQNENMFFITVPGEHNVPIVFALERNGILIGVTEQELPFIANTVLGTINKPAMLLFKDEATLIMAYPSPVRNILTISMRSQTVTNFEISIVDVAGKVVVEKTSAFIKNGISNTPIDCSFLHSGIYLVNVRYDGINKVRKFIKE